MRLRRPPGWAPGPAGPGPSPTELAAASGSQCVVTCTVTSAGSLSRPGPGPRPAATQWPLPLSHSGRAGSGTGHGYRDSDCHASSPTGPGHPIQWLGTERTGRRPAAVLQASPCGRSESDSAPPSRSEASSRRRPGCAEAFDPSSFARPQGSKGLGIDVR